MCFQPGFSPLILSRELRPQCRPGSEYRMSFQMLCMEPEENLQTFSVDSFLPPLIRLVNFEASAEIMLLACRAIAYIIEAIPGSSAAVVHFGSITPLCNKLMAIEYIDVAEQALLTLHKISNEHAGQLLRARGIPAVLSHLDFFPISSQRTGMMTVANMCKRVNSESIGSVLESIPQMSEMVLHTDGTVAEHVCTSFCRLVSSLSSNKEALEQIAGQGLIPNVWKVVSSWLLSSTGADKDKTAQHANFGVELCSQLLQMLATIASTSPKLCALILAQPEVGQVLRSKILVERLEAGGGDFSSAAAAERRRSSMEHSSKSSPQLLRAVMALTSALLPVLPTMPPREVEALKSAASGAGASKRGGKSKSGGKHAQMAAAIAAAMAEEVALEREKVDEGMQQWKQHTGLLEDFGEQLFEAVLSMATLSIDSTVRLDSIVALCKLCYFMETGRIDKLLPKLQVCELISALLASEGVQLRFAALLLVHDLMNKAKDEWLALFTREGIVFMVQKLCNGKGKGSAMANKREEVNSALSLASWMSRSGASTIAKGNSLQEVNEATLSAMLDFVSNKFFSASNKDCEDSADATPVVRELRRLGTAMIKAGEKGDEESAKESLEAIMSHFETSVTVSTFEMQNSGICENLIQFLSRKKDGKDKSKATVRGGGSKQDTPTQLQAVAFEQRWDAFTALLAKHHTDDGHVRTTGQVLASKLVAALNNAEGFELGSHLLAAESQGQALRHSRQIFQPLRLRFVRKGDAKALREYPNPVVIDPLASINAVHDFLWPRVRQSARELAASSSSTGSSGKAPAGSGRGSRKSGAGDSNVSGSRSRSSRSKTDTSSGKDSKGKGASHDGSSMEVESAPDVMRRSMALFFSDPEHDGYSDEEMSEMLHDDDGDDDDDDDDDGDDMPEILASVPSVHSAVDDDDGDALANAEMMEDDMEMDDDEHDDGALEMRMQARVVDINLEQGEESQPATSTAGLPAASEPAGEDGAGKSSRKNRSSKGKLAGDKSHKSSDALSGKAGKAKAGSVPKRTSESLKPSGTGEEAGAGSSAEGAAASGPQRKYLQLRVGGTVLGNHSISIIEAILLGRSTRGSGDGSGSARGSSRAAGGSASSASAPPASDSRTALWTTAHVIEYEPAVEATVRAGLTEQSATAHSGSAPVMVTSAVDLPDGPVRSRAAAMLLSDSAENTAIKKLRLPERTSSMIKLIGLLHSLNADLPVDDPCRISGAEMVVNNLSCKAASVIRDPLSVFINQVPEWITALLSAFPFLLSHTVRKSFFELQAFGLFRALKNASRDARTDRQSANSSVQTQRQKVRVGRNMLLQSARKIMEIYSRNGIAPGSTLEVEFSGEVGVGAGPTQEFFSSLCREVQRRDLGLWWDQEGPVAAQKAGEEPAGKDKDGGTALVHAAHGLFPAPLGADTPEPERKRRIDAFTVLGWICGKAVQDGRLLDLPLGVPLCYALLGAPLEARDLAQVAPSVHTTLERLRPIAAAKAAGEGELTLDGVELQDLCVSFTVPGYDNVPLKEGGADTLLSLANLEEYLSLVPRAVLTLGVRPLVEAFRAGFSRVLPASALRLFCVEELQELLGAQDRSLEGWTPEGLLHHFKFEHGYTSSSPAARLLVEVLAALPEGAKRKFVAFCTGCPRLPPGGFAALRPALTVVKKESTLDPADQQLPSVMTCANYLKLPDYSNPDVLRDRLLVTLPPPPPPADVPAGRRPPC